MRHIKRYWQFVFPILVMILIWSFSAQNGDDSDGLSIPLAIKLGLSNGIVRKLAHFCVYALLGLSLSNAFRSLNPKKFPNLKAVLFSLAIAIIYSSIDEFHQSFIPERDGNPTDVIIDSLGAMAGICSFVAIFSTAKQRKAGRKKAFTIIEVVLVLAIAGLIFLMVFIALPALQRSQRNTRRRQDMSRILSAFTEYQSNNGKPPMTSNEIADLVNKYINGSGSQAPSKLADFIQAEKWQCGNLKNFCDPDGSSYIMSLPIDLTWYSPNDSDDFSHIIHYYINAQCDPNSENAKRKDGSNNIALTYTLEGSAIYCGDNQ